MKTLTFILFLTITVLSQTTKYAQAPEIWSKPEEIRAISDWAGSVENIAVSADGRILYISVSGVSVSELSDTGWTTPYKLGSHINRDYYVNAQAITPSGNRLFYTWRVGDIWYLFYSDRDTITGEWENPVDCGPEVNQPYGIGGVAAPDDTTIVFLRYETAYIAHFNDSTKQYENVKGFINDGLNYVSAYGIAIKNDFSKVYQLLPQTDTTLAGNHYLKEDLVVSYNPIDYPPPGFVLNISYQADTLYFNGEYSSRGQGYPAITADGKTLFFVADYHGKQTVYTSHLLIDENGIPVSVNYRNPELPIDFRFFPTYPNPFNPSTTIEYELNRASEIKLLVYDMLGRKITEIYNGLQKKGKHTNFFDATGLSSGVYIVVLYTSTGFSTKKITYLK